jgi:hypothetical protein
LIPCAGLRGELGLVNEERDSAIRAELAPGELVLWSGRPRRGLTLEATDAFMIPFSLLWAGFAVFWEVSALAGDAPVFFLIWGIPFLAVGAYITVGRFFWDARQRARTHYALTDRRALVISGGRRHLVSSTDLRHLGTLEVTEHRGGRATLTFGASTMPMWRWVPAGWPMAGQYRPAAFRSIEDGRRVYELFRDAEYRAVSGTPSESTRALEPGGWNQPSA